MAQTGYSVLSLYYSATASAVPTAGNLVAGELAINTADGKLFYKDSAGVVQTIAGKGGAGVAGGSTTQVQYNSSGSLAGSANMTYSTSGGMTVNGVTQGYNTTLYTVDGALSNYSSTNAVYLNGNRAGWLDLQADGTGNTYIQLFGTTNATPNYIGFYTNTTERMRIDSSGNVGIGATPGSTNKLQVSSTGTTRIYLENTTNSVGVRLQTLSNAGLLQTDTNHPLTFATNNGAEAMRIDTSGNLLVNTTSLNSGKVNIVASGASQPCMIWNDSDATSASQGIVSIRRNGSAVGLISTTNAITTYASLSDYRLKENIAPMQNGLNVVQKLKPVTYKWKSTGEESQGFIAHELQAVVPDCVTGEKDAVETVDELDEDGKIIGTKEVPKYQGIDTSFLVATLTAAIQELNAKVDAQAVEIANLKAK